jgi:hypothetical protein
MYAYCYNHRISEGENNVESVWCLGKLSSTLSSLEVKSQGCPNPIHHTHMYYFFLCIHSNSRPWKILSWQVIAARWPTHSTETGRYVKRCFRMCISCSSWANGRYWRRFWKWRISLTIMTFTMCTARSGLTTTAFGSSMPGKIAYKIQRRGTHLWFWDLLSVATLYYGHWRMNCIILRSRRRISNGIWRNWKR